MLTFYSVHGKNAACISAMGVGFLCNPLVFYPPYTGHMFSAAYLGGMCVGVLGDVFLCYLSTPRLNATCLHAMGSNVPLLCCTTCNSVRVRAAQLWPILLRFVWASPVYPTVRLDAALILRLGWMVPFSALSSFLYG